MNGVYLNMVKMAKLSSYIFHYSLEMSKMNHGFV